MSARWSLRELLTYLEERVLLGPDIDPNITLSISAHISGTRTDTSSRRHGGIAFFREDTQNAGLDRDATQSYVRDVVLMEYSHRVSPKNQRGSRDLAYRVVDALLHRVTDRHDPKLAPLHPRLVSQDEFTLPSDSEPEWLIIHTRLELDRLQAVGAV